MAVRARTELACSRVLSRRTVSLVNATRPLAPDAPKVSKAEPVRRIRGVSPFALELLATAAHIAFVTADSFSRPLAAAGLWANRAQPFLSAESVVNLVLGLSASGTSEAVKAVEILKLMVLQAGSSPPLSVTHTSFPPGVTYAPFPPGRPFYGYLIAIVSGLVSLNEAGRDVIAHTMKELHWELEICPEAPFLATIRYADHPCLLTRSALEFRPSAEFLAANNADTPGIARVLKVPFSVFVAAAEAVLESDRRAAAAQSRTAKPAGRRRAASLVPEMEKAAGPDDHNDLSTSLQPKAASNSLVGRQPANEQTHEVSNEQCNAGSISVQRLGSLRLVNPARKTTPRVFAPTGVAPPCPEMTLTSRSPTRRPSSSPTQLPLGALRRRTPGSMRS